MHGFIVIDALGVVAVLLTWYLLLVRYNRRRSKQILQRLRGAFAPQAQIMSVRWMGSSRFTVRLRVVSTLFQQATLQVRMHPRQIPFLWIWERLRKRQEQMTFEADLECPPGFNLEVQNHRWCGRTRKFPRDLRRMALDQCGPFVLTTRNDWQREITGMMSALVASRDCDFLSVNFRRTSPHFSATLALDSVASESGCELQFFDVLQELASCAQVTKF
jgi:hypothetical protein